MKRLNPESWRRHLHPNDPDAEDVPEFLECDERDPDEPFAECDGPRNYIPPYEP